MARRIDIELTSARPDGSWTWRAAGAKEPRGVLDGSLLPPSVKPGDVLKAEADFEIDGITIVAVLPPKADSRPQAQVIEILGPSRPDVPGVTTQLVGRRPGERHRDRGDREDSRPRRDRDGGRPPGGRAPGRPPREGAATAEGEAPAQSDRPRPASGEQGSGGRPPRSREPRAGSGDQSAGSAGRPPRSRDGRPGPGGRRPPREGAPAEGSAETEDRKARRLTPGHKHRQEVMASLPPEQQPIAEQVLRGGIPAVRTALHLEREKAAAEGRAAPNTDQLIAMAEELLPRLKAADWHDRAEAAAKDPDSLSLRDLRSVVAGSDAARTEETRTLAATLREALERRVVAMRTQWSDEVTKHLDDRRVVRALRLAARPPEPAARLDSELSQRLTDAASQAMAPDTPPDRWIALIEAVAESPVRRAVKPVGLPPEASPEIRQAAYQQSGRIPALATMLGISIPPPPTPTAPRTRPGRGGPGGGAGGGAAGRRRDGEGGRGPRSGAPGGGKPAAGRAGPPEPAPTAEPAGPPVAEAAEPVVAEPAPTAEPPAPPEPPVSDGAEAPAAETVEAAAADPAEVPAPPEAAAAETVEAPPAAEVRTAETVEATESLARPEPPAPDPPAPGPPAAEAVGPEPDAAESSPAPGTRHEAAPDPPVS